MNFQNHIHFLSAPVKKINNYKGLKPVRGISPLVL